MTDDKTPVRHEPLSHKPLPHKPAPALLIPLLLIALLCFLVALVLFTGSTYLAPGYTTTTSRDISASGFQIWDIHLAGVLMLIGLLPVTGLLLAWQPLTKRPPAIGLAMGLCVAGMALSILFTPGPWDFQVRYYASPGESYTIARSYRADGLVQLTHEHAFETFRDLERGYSKTFLCRQKTQLRLGAVRIDRGFYPILDDENRLALLEAHCQS